jgi:hypothetical protein
MSDIYIAVNHSSLPGQSKNTPNPYCVVGKLISKQLEDLSENVKNALIAQLSKISLKKFIIPLQ